MVLVTKIEYLKKINYYVARKEKGDFMAEKTLTVQEYANHFGLICISGHTSALKREIKEVSINRPGIELAGFFNSPRSKRLIFFGNHEIDYCEMLEEDKLKKAYDFLLCEECPGAIICQGRDCPPLLLEIAKERDFPIYLTNRQTNDFNVESVIYLQDALAPYKAVHATLVEIYSTGVLILGESGIGKSEIALELVKKGHQLIADDRVDVSCVRGKLYGEAPELLKGMMEVRGIGIIDIARMFGINALVKKMEISYAIELVKYDPKKDVDRLGDNTKYYEIHDHKIPLLQIPVYAGRNLSEIIEVAVTNLKLKDDGIDSTHDFKVRLNELIERKRTKQ